MRKDIPEWIKSIPKHKMDEAVAEIIQKARRAREEIPTPNVPNVDGHMREAMAFRRGVWSGIAEAIEAFEKQTIMASVQKKKAKEPA